MLEANSSSNATPSPDAVLPALDAEQLRALREVGSEWGQSSNGRSRSLPIDPSLSRQPELSQPTRGGRFVHVKPASGSQDELEATLDEDGAGLDPTDARRPVPPRRPRAAAQEHRNRAGADEEAGRAAGTFGRRALIGGLRPGGDARRPCPRGRCRPRLVAADLGGDRLPDAGGGTVLPPDDPRLSPWWGLVHRCQREPRPGSRIAGRSRTDHRLRADGGGLNLLRSRGRDIGRPVAAGGGRADRCRATSRFCWRQLTRCAPGGCAVRRADVRVYLRDCAAADRRVRRRGPTWFSPGPGLPFFTPPRASACCLCCAPSRLARPQ